MLSILKLEYRHYFYNISKTKNELKTTTIITNDGVILTKFHSPKDDKIIAVKKAIALLKNLKNYVKK